MKKYLTDFILEASLLIALVQHPAIRNLPTSSIIALKCIYTPILISTFWRVFNDTISLRYLFLSTTIYGLFVIAAIDNSGYELPAMMVFNFWWRCYCSTKWIAVLLAFLMTKLDRNLTMRTLLLGGSQYPKRFR